MCSCKFVSILAQCRDQRCMEPRWGFMKDTKLNCKMSLILLYESPPAETRLTVYRRLSVRFQMLHFRNCIPTAPAAAIRAPADFRLQRLLFRNFILSAPAAAKMAPTNFQRQWLDFKNSIPKAPAASEMAPENLASDPENLRSPFRPPQAPSDWNFENLASNIENSQAILAAAGAVGMKFRKSSL